MLFFDGTRIFRGAAASGERLFTVDGGRLLVGSDANGVVIYTVKDNRIFEGTAEGPVIYTIRGEYLFTGTNAPGQLVFRANRSLETSMVRFLLPILADGRF